MLSKSICFAVIGGLLVALVGCGGSSSKSADSAGGDDVALDVSTADLADTSTGGDFIVTGDTTPSDALQTCEPPLGTPATDNCSGTDDRSALASANPAEAISTCLAQHGDPFDSDGLTCCLAAALKVSPNCSTCFRELAICTRDNCQNECELGSDETCRNCADEKGCTATFELCAGTTSGGEDTLTPDATSDLVTGDALDDALTDAPTADLEDDSAADDLSTSDTATLDSEPGDGLQADVLADLAADLEDDGALGQDADGGDDADL